MRDGMALSSFSLPFSINMRQDGHATAGMGSFGARHVTWGIPHLNADACAFPMWHLCVRPLQGDIVLMSKLLGCYLAATIHDYGHRGVNNDFLIKTSDPLALLYNDVSPMENHHVAAAFILMQEEQYAFFSVPNKRVRSRGAPWGALRNYEPDVCNPLTCVYPSSHGSYPLSSSTHVLCSPCHPKSNASLPFVQFKEMLRKDIIELILATDMKQVSSGRASPR